MFHVWIQICPQHGTSWAEVDFRQAPEQPFPCRQRFRSSFPIKAEAEQKSWGLSSTAKDKTPKEIDMVLETFGYPDYAREILRTNWKEAAKDVEKYKKAYGNGVSTKLMFCNVAGEHYLHQDGVEIVRGKKVSNPDTHLPDMIELLGVEAGFHGKRSLETTGSFGAVQYCVQDDIGRAIAYVVIAWGQPYSGTARCHIGVSVNKFNVRQVAEDCDDDKIKNYEHKLGEPNLSGEDCVQVFAKTIDGSTAEIFVVIKSDTIKRKTYKGLPLPK